MKARLIPAAPVNAPQNHKNRLEIMQHKEMLKMKIALH